MTTIKFKPTSNPIVLIQDFTSERGEAVFVQLFKNGNASRLRGGAPEIMVYQFGTLLGVNSSRYWKDSTAASAEWSVREVDVEMEIDLGK